MTADESDFGDLAVAKNRLQQPPNTMHNNNSGHLDGKLVGQESKRCKPTLCILYVCLLLCEAILVNACSMRICCCECICVLIAIYIGSWCWFAIGRLYLGIWWLAVAGAVWMLYTVYKASKRSTNVPKSNIDLTYHGWISECACMLIGAVRWRKECRHSSNCRLFASWLYSSRNQLNQRAVK